MREMSELRLRLGRLMRATSDAEIQSLGAEITARAAALEARAFKSPANAPPRAAVSSNATAANATAGKVAEKVAEKSAELPGWFRERLAHFLVEVTRRSYRPLPYMTI